MRPDAFNHVAYCVYGDNVAYQVFGQGAGAHRVIIIRNPGIADMFRRQFEFNWAAAEVPWFAKRFRPMDAAMPWSAKLAQQAREWIDKQK
jgi:hypothetical protein